MLVFKTSAISRLATPQGRVYLHLSACSLSYSTLQFIQTANANDPQFVVAFRALRAEERDENGFGERV